jgi:hypothetical protein
MPIQFHVTEEPWGHHYKVVASDGEGGKRHFFIENKKPDLTIHDGTEIDGPIVGLSRFRRFTSNCDIRLDDAGEWMSLAKKGVVTPSYTFQIPLHGQMTHLAWKKTRSMGSFYGPYGNLKLVDEQSLDVMAVFSSNGDSLVTGRLDMYGDYGESFDRMALLTALAVRERSRRQTTRSARVGHENVYTTGACGGAGGGAC